MSSLPLNHSRCQGSREQAREIRVHHLVAAIGIAELELTHNGSGDRSKLDAGELLTNAPVSACSEREVGAGSAFADESVTVIELLFLDVGANDTTRSFIPSVGVPFGIVGEVLVLSAGDTGCSQKTVGRGDGVFRAWDGHGILDRAQDRVDRRMESQGLLDNSLKKRESRKVFVLQRWKVSSQDVDLFLVELLHNIWSGSKSKHDPSAGGR